MWIKWFHSSFYIVDLGCNTKALLSRLYFSNLICNTKKFSLTSLLYISFEYCDRLKYFRFYSHFLIWNSLFYRFLSCYYYRPCYVCILLFSLLRFDSIFFLLIWHCFGTKVMWFIDILLYFVLKAKWSLLCLVLIMLTNTWQWVAVTLFATFVVVFRRNYMNKFDFFVFHIRYVCISFLLNVLFSSIVF